MAELYVALSAHGLNMLVTCRLVKRQERIDAKAAKRQQRIEAKEARRASAAGGWWPGLRQRHASNGSHPAHPDAITNADLKSVAQKPAKPRDDTADFGAPLLQYFRLLVQQGFEAVLAAWTYWWHLGGSQTAGFKHRSQADV